MQWRTTQMANITAEARTSIFYHHPNGKYKNPITLFFCEEPKKNDLLLNANLTK
jgi:hypothetical protein